jgi:hypothetical protein
MAMGLGRVRLGMCMYLRGDFVNDHIVVVMLRDKDTTNSKVTNRKAPNNLNTMSLFPFPGSLFKTSNKASADIYKPTPTKRQDK